MTKPVTSSSFITMIPSEFHGNFCFDQVNRLKLHTRRIIRNFAKLKARISCKVAICIIHRSLKHRSLINQISFQNSNFKKLNWKLCIKRHNIHRTDLKSVI